jgi:hypothetical protein
MSDQHAPRGVALKLLGFMMLLAGWGIILAAVILLSQMPARMAFVIAGLGVEVLGFGLVVRSHPISKGEEE